MMRFMKLSLNQLLIAFLLSVNFLSAKDLGLSVSYTEFMNDENENYLELYFALDARTLHYQKTPSGLYTGGLEITATLMADSSITAADKFRIKLTPAEDTTAFQQILVQQSRLPLTGGKQWITLQLVELSRPDDTIELKQRFEPQLGGNEVMASTILPLQSFSPAETKGSFTKSGFELVPMVTNGSYYFTEDDTELAFYQEIYNTATALGDTGEYLLRYYLRNADTQDKLNEYASFSKKNSSEVEPLLASFDIKNLPTGNYDLVVEAIDKNGNTLLEESMFFYRKNAVQLDPLKTISSETVSSSFVSKIRSIDSLRLYLDYLTPVSNDRQQGYIKNLIAQDDTEMMRSYLYSFWSQIAPDNPEQAWEDYLAEVRFVNQNFDSQLSPGYKTDRGTVYLRYGAPSMKQKRTMEPQMPPYSLWQYNRIETPFALPQVNKMFVFADIHRGTDMFELIHSTAVGERSSRRWRQELAFRYRGGQINADETGYSDQDTWGSRLNDNLIFQGTGSDRNRRYD